MQKKELTCMICGKHFVGNPNSKYCSEDCKLSASRKRYAELSEENRQTGRECVVCGKTFYPEHKGRKTCSDECAARWVKIRQGYKVSIGDTITCAICGKDFTVRTANNRYCSDACKITADHRRLAARRKTGKPKPPKQETVPAPLSLDEMVRRADKRGVSYGRYVAMREAGT